MAWSQPRRGSGVALAAVALALLSCAPPPGAEPAPQAVAGTPVTGSAAPAPATATAKLLAVGPAIEPGEPTPRASQRLRVIVWTLDAKPLPGATVCVLETARVSAESIDLSRLEPIRPVAVATTDARGRGEVDLSGLPEVPLSLVLTHPSLPRPQIQPNAIPDDRWLILLAMCGEGTALRLRLRTPDGSEPRAEVAARGVGSETVAEQHPRGELCTLLGLPPGPVDVGILSHEIWAPVIRHVELAPGVIGELEVVLAPGSTMSGRVLDPQGKLVEGVIVAATYRLPGLVLPKPLEGCGVGGGGGPAPGYQFVSWDRDGAVRVGTVTGEAGTFTVTGLPTGIPIELEATLDRCVVATATRPAGAPSVDLRLLHREPDLVVVVEPVPDPEDQWGADTTYYVRVVQVGDGIESGYAQSGLRFPLRGLKAGPCVIWAEGQVAHTIGVARADVTPGSGTEVHVRAVRDARVTLKAIPAPPDTLEGWGVFGSVLVDGAPFPVHAFGEGEDPSEWARLPASRPLVLAVRIPGYEPWQTQVELAPGESRDLGEIRLTRRTGD